MAEDQIPYDRRLATEAAAVDQMMKLGAVLLKPASKQSIGFVQPPSQPKQPQDDLNRRRKPRL